MTLPGLGFGLRTGRAPVTYGYGRFVLIPVSSIGLPGSHESIVTESGLADLLVMAEASAAEKLVGLLGSDDFLISSGAVEQLEALRGSREASYQRLGSDDDLSLAGDPEDAVGLPGDHDPQVGLEGEA